MFRRVFAFAATLAALVAIAAPQPASAQSPPASIQIHLIKGSYFVGAKAGSGYLMYRGRSYPLSIGGLSLGLSIGGSSADLVGEVYNLQTPADIEGVYGSAAASYAVASGETIATLTNARGVELHLRGRQVGLELSLDLSGLAIALD